ncbi:hypothetical protein [Agromyces sp. NPDC049794]|uniref:hypothetical protein n=1 Tax=unclassified Agromyces TaxID=2639701 RepID=UPI0033F1D1A5
MTPPDRARRWALLVLAIYAALGAVVVLIPRPIDQGFTPWVRGLLAHLRSHGLAPWITYEVVEYASHVVLFAPLGILTVVVFGRRMSWLAVPLLLGACALVEFTPTLLGFDHEVSAIDLALNVVGAIGGAAIGYWAAPPARRRTAPLR